MVALFCSLKRKISLKPVPPNPMVLSLLNFSLTHDWLRLGLKNTHLGLENYTSVVWVTHFTLHSLGFSCHLTVFKLDL